MEFNCEIIINSIMYCTRHMIHLLLNLPTKILTVRNFSFQLVNYIKHLYHHSCMEYLGHKNQAAFQSIFKLIKIMATKKCLKKVQVSIFSFSHIMFALDVYFLFT